MHTKVYLNVRHRVVSPARIAERTTSLEIRLKLQHTSGLCGSHQHLIAEAPNEPKPVPVPLPEGVRHQRVGETTEHSAHLEKLKQLFEAAPISRYLGMTLSYCENGVAHVRLPFRAEFEESHGVIHGGLIGLLADTAGNFAGGSVSPGSTVKTVEFKMSLLEGVQKDLLAIGEVVRKGRTLATCRLEVVGGNDHVVAIGLATYALQAV